MSGSPTISVAEARRPFFLGVDVGGTNIKLGLIDDLGRTVAKSSIPTVEERGPADAIARVRAASDLLLAKCSVPLSDVAAVGIGTPGSMDIPGGLILEPPNLPHWRHFPVRNRLSEAFGKPVAFNNDANAAAFGEHWAGSGRDHPCLILLTLGTGVGGGIIVNGKLIEGVNSFGSECGHIVVDSTSAARCCAWGGGQGELEAYASASAVMGRTADALATGRASSLTARLQRGETLTALMVAQEAAAGDDLALEIVLETARYLGIGIVTFVHSIDPGLVLLGGAMNFGGPGTPLGERFLDAIRAEFRRRAFPQVVPVTRIEFATLGGDAGFVGAAGLARDLWRETASK